MLKSALPSHHTVGLAYHRFQPRESECHVLLQFTLSQLPLHLVISAKKDVIILDSAIFSPTEKILFANITWKNNFFFFNFKNYITILLACNHPGNTKRRYIPREWEHYKLFMLVITQFLQLLLEFLLTGVTTSSFQVKWGILTKGKKRDNLYFLRYGF